jgi:hypothetical protein
MDANKLKNSAERDYKNAKDVDGVKNAVLKMRDAAMLYRQACDEQEAERCELIADRWEAML